VRIIVEGQITSMGGIEWKQLKKINYGQDFAQKKIKNKKLEMKRSWRFFNYQK
jgi:hypothetical protein